MKNTVALIHACAAVALVVSIVEARPMHAGIDYHRYLQDEDTVGKELDKWMDKYEADASANGWLPQTESRSADEVREDRKQRLFMAKDLVSELSKQNPDAQFSTDSPFSLMTTEEFAAYIKNSYIAGEATNRMLRTTSESDDAADNQKRNSTTPSTAERSFNFDDKWGNGINDQGTVRADPNVPGTGGSTIYRPNAQPRFPPTLSPSPMGPSATPSTTRAGDSLPVAPNSQPSSTLQPAFQPSTNSRPRQPTTPPPFAPFPASPMTRQPNTFPVGPPGSFPSRAPAPAPPRPFKPSSPPSPNSFPVAPTSRAPAPAPAPPRTYNPAPAPVGPVAPDEPVEPVGPVAPVVAPSNAPGPAPAPAPSSDDSATGGDGSSIDWSKNKCMPPVQNQGQCGSCWAFATVAGVEAGKCLATKASSYTKLSEQDIATCDTRNGGCNGGSLGSAMQYIQQSGVCSATDVPYTMGNGRQVACSSGCTKVASGIKSLPKVSGEAGLVSTLNTHPVVIAVAAGNNAWKQYQGGVLSSCDTTRVDHAVLAVGFDATTIRIRNSWGTSWGEQGYVRIKRGGGGSGVCAMYTDMIHATF